MGSLLDIDKDGLRCAQCPESLSPVRRDAPKRVGLFVVYRHRSWDKVGILESIHILLWILLILHSLGHLIAIQ